MAVEIMAPTIKSTHHRIDHIRSYHGSIIGKRIVLLSMYSETANLGTILEPDQASLGVFISTKLPHLPDHFGCLVRCSMFQFSL